VDMAVAIAMVHGANGLFMNWAGTQKGEGFEFHLLALALLVVVLLRGAGALSLDGMVARWRKQDAVQAQRQTRLAA